jgi:hypothetical protein
VSVRARRDRPTEVSGPRLHAHCSLRCTSPWLDGSSSQHGAPGSRSRRLAGRTDAYGRPRRSARPAGPDRVDRRRVYLRRGRGRRGRRGRRGWCWRNGALAAAGRLDRPGRRTGQEQQRVEVSLLLGSLANPEVHVGDVELGNAAGPDGADRISLLHGLSPPHVVRAEVHQGRGVAVRRLDRDGLAATRDAAGERDGPGGGRHDGSPGIGPDVDPSVLSRRVRVRLIERERAQHGARHRPGPAER